MSYYKISITHCSNETTELQINSEKFVLFNSQPSFCIFFMIAHYLSRQTINFCTRDVSVCFIQVCKLFSSACNNTEMFLSVMLNPTWRSQFDFVFSIRSIDRLNYARSEIAVIKTRSTERSWNASSSTWLILSSEKPLETFALLQPLISFVKVSGPIYDATWMPIAGTAHKSFYTAGHSACAHFFMPRIKCAP